MNKDTQRINEAYEGQKRDAILHQQQSKAKKLTTVSASYFDRWMRDRGVWPRLNYEEIFQAGFEAGTEHARTAKNLE